MLRVNRLHQPLYPLVAGMATFRQPRARKALRAGPSVTFYCSEARNLHRNGHPDLPVSAEPADSWRKQAFTLTTGLRVKSRFFTN